MEPQITIRKAVSADVEIVFQFISHLEERSFDFTSFKEKFTDNIEKPDILYLVATNKQDEAIGFISGHGQTPIRLEGSLFEVQEVYVAKSYRVKGIEQKLFEALQEQVAKRDCERIEVSADISRIDAKRFYMKMGFSSILARYVKVV